MIHTRTLTGKITYLALMTAAAAILGYLESLLSLAPPVPGMKLGLCNIVILAVLYADGPKEALMVSAARILLTGFLFGSLPGIVYSLSGSLLSILVMTLLLGSGRFSLFGVSAAGGAAHNLGQLLASLLLLPELPFWDYLPLLLVTGLVTGCLIGLLLLLLLPRLPKGYSDAM